ncbi:hypothetical protein UY456_23110 [Paenibacillus polymyxa]|uniref:DUF7662 domain-containing protein n=1 Tax=Paenibacillus peoriae TaxID=59893 RepID=A0ABU1Q9H5_9BACL|nr:MULTISPECIES: hypothetical protein [Paenibacillus]MDR6776273.1 hypothetical protein [Paenibacillus peoriae]MDY8095861.1 hypothetical protein [Paenibacillus polymyxa]
MSKYDPLENYLKGITVTLSYTEIEQILGSELPPTAYERDQWWANNTNNHTQARSWLNAGWKVRTVDLGKSVTFIRN